MSERPHPLLQWLRDNKVTREELCQAVDVSQVHLSQIMSGSRRPSLDLVDRITLATGGAIRANHWQQIPTLVSSKTGA